MACLIFFNSRAVGIFFENAYYCGYSEKRLSNYLILFGPVVSVMKNGHKSER